MLEKEYVMYIHLYIYTITAPALCRIRKYSSQIVLFAPDVLDACNLLLMRKFARQIGIIRDKSLTIELNAVVSVLLEFQAKIIPAYYNLVLCNSEVREKYDISDKYLQFDKTVSKIKY